MRFKLSVLTCALSMAMYANAWAETDIEKLRAEVDVLKDQVKSAAEWKEPSTLVHLAGFASVGYTDTKSEPGTFNTGSFSPILHYQFNRDVMLEAELEFATDEAGNSDASIEYMTIDLFMNDYAALVVGKFLSPLGQFRQNMHPSWINKMASAPVGIGHDQAAPNAEIGAMVRGGFPLSGIYANYAAYLGNGPVLEADAGEMEKIESPGVNKDGDGKKVGGGRFGLYFPSQKLDLGVSAATGKVAVRTLSGSTYTYDDARSYDVLGADFTWKINQLDVRGEYIKQEYGAQASSSAPDAGTWEAWYVQAAYGFGGAKWEAVLRYGEYDTPQFSKDRKQSMVGINYLFASNVVGKVDYEFNDNPNAGLMADDRLLLQLAYGF